MDLFPAAQASQQNLCDLEIADLGTNEALLILKDVLSGQDRYLEAAICKATEDHVSNIQPF